MLSLLASKTEIKAKKKKEEDFPFFTWSQPVEKI